MRLGNLRVLLVGLLLSVWTMGGLAFAAPSEVCIQGTLTNHLGALYGERLWRVQYYDAQTGGNALGAAATGTTLVDHEGRWSIHLTPPAEVLNATGEVWYELAIDSGPAPDGTLSAQDVFPDRVKVESVLFAQRALVADQAPQADSATTASISRNALALGGLAAADFATTSALSSGLAGKSDTTHSHNLQNLGGAVTDAQVPDSITVDHAADADLATTASVALTVLGDTVNHSTLADTADLATTASTARNALNLGGLAPSDYATTSALTSGLAGKSDTTHSHNLQSLGGAVTDAQVPDTITISSGGAVDAAALKSGTVPSARLSLADSDVPNDLTISGGTVNDTPIGASTASMGAFTTLAADTVNTGQGANELYAMDQDVRTSDDVTFNEVTATTATFGTNSVTIDDNIVVGSSGRVGLGTSSPVAVLDVDVAASAVLDQSQESYSSSRMLTNHRQSFTAGRTGLLAKVSFRPSSTPPTDATLKIYAGEGTGGALLHTQTGIGGTDMVWEEVELSGPVQVTAGTQYTFELSQATPFLLLRADDLYPGGMYDNSSDVDLVFRTYVLGAPADSLRVTSQMVIEPVATAPSSTTARLYNLENDLYWNGVRLTTGSTLNAAHTHNLQDLGGAVTDSQVPDTITISSSGSVDAAALKSGTVPSARLNLADSDVPNDLTISGGTVNDTPIGAWTPSTGAFTMLAAGTLDTGHGANELYDMDQNVQTTDAVTFSTVDTGHGANELYDMDQNVQTTDAVTFSTVDTGQGANELYAMDQNVQTTDAVTFGTVDTGQGANELYAMDQNVQTSDDVAFAKATLGASEAMDANFTGSGIGWGFGASNLVGQVFRASASGSLTKCVLTLGHQGTQGDVSIAIYSGATPGSGSQISSVETVTVTNDYWTSLDQYEFVFSTPAPVTASQQYYILIDATTNMNLLGMGGNAYTDGLLWSDFGSGWVEYSNNDIWFKTYVLAVGDALAVQGVAQISDTADPPSTTAERLYNNGGDLYWAGSQVVTAASVSVDKDEINNTGTLSFDWADGEVADTLTISGGTVNNTPIGASTASTGAFTTLVANTLNTGQGANELYAMDQDVRTTDDVTFGSVATSGDITVASGSHLGIGTASPAGLLHVQAPAGGSVATGGTASWTAGYYQPASNAFDGDDSTVAECILQNQGLRYDLGAGVSARVTSYRVVCLVAFGTSDWRLEGSNDASSWDVLDTRSGQDIHAGLTYSVASPGVYRYYQLWGTASLNGGTRVTVGELGLYVDPGQMVVDSSGNVGIGTASPSESLDVNGVVMVQDTTGPPATTTDRLYNNGGDLYWNGTQLGGAGGLATSAAQYVFVQLADGNTDAENGAALQAALTAARALTPSTTNRVAVIVPPGRYDLGTGAVALDTPYMDLIGLTPDREAQYIYGVANGANTGVILQTADNVRIENLSVEHTNTTFTRAYDSSDPAAYFPNVSWNGGTEFGSSANTVIKNCVFDCDNLTHCCPMRLGNASDVYYAGSYTNCVGPSYSFGANGGMVTGTFTDCTGGAYSFGGKVGTHLGYVSGTFVRCTGGDYSFGAYGTINSTASFTDCTGGTYSFANGGAIVGGTFVRCTSGNYSFGGTISDGTFRDCRGGTDCFGKQHEAAGTYINCVAENSSFASMGTASGTFINCHVVGAGARIGFGGYGGHASGTFKHCTAGDYSFGGYLSGTDYGKFYHCVAGDNSYHGYGTYLYCIRNDATYP